MAEYYLDYATGDDTNTGDAWGAGHALKTFEHVVEAHATSDGDFIYVAHTHDEPLSADTTITFAATVTVLCRNTGTNAVTTGAKIGNQATNYYITLAGAENVYIYGIEFMNGTNTSSSKNLTVWTDGSSFEFESCTFTVRGDSSYLVLGPADVGTANQYIKVKNSTITFGKTYQCISTRGAFIEFENVTIGAGVATPDTLLKPQGNGGRFYATGCSFSAGTALVGNAGTSGSAELILANCKVPATIYTAATTVLNKGQTSVWVYNCASADTHYNFAHYDPLGSTEAVVTYCLTGGASYNGTNPVSWRITTTANCSFWYPYVSPWIDKYCGDTSTSITPSLEVLRVGSTTAYLDTEIWGEFSIQDSTNTTQAVLYNDRYSVSGSTALPIQTSSGANQADGVGYASWNAGSSSATSSDDSIKLAVAAVTPNEIGHIRARVIVGVASASDIYVDPYIYLT